MSHERADVPGLRRARTCYDHLGGRLGVVLLEAFERDGAIVVDGAGPTVTLGGVARLRALGVDLESARRSRRPFARLCLDWTERRPHLAGALGAALADRLLAAGWVERRAAGRAIDVTERERAQLAVHFGIGLDEGFVPNAASG